jgi:hypothetical protein
MQLIENERVRVMIEAMGLFRTIVFLQERLSMSADPLPAIEYDLACASAYAALN